MDATSTTCPHCSKVFSTVGNLKIHLKGNKTCSVIQGRPPPPNPVCSYCNESYSTVYRLRDHMEKCAKTFEEKKHHEDLQSRVKAQEEQINQMKVDHAMLITEKELEKDRELEALRDVKDRELAKKDRELDELRDELFECRIRIAKLEQACDDSKEHLQDSKEMLAKSMDDMWKIAAQTRVIDHTDDGDAEEEIPLTVGQRLHSMEDSSAADYMTTLSELTLNNVIIISRRPDHYVNATQLCQAGSKKFNDWFGMESTKELIAVLSSDAGIPASLLVESKRGATSQFRQGSWVHPDLAIQIAQWISPSFAIQVSRWVRTLFDSGNLSIDLAVMKEQQKRIDALESVCLAKRRREKYEGQFVVYLITTEDHIKRRTFIIGKAKNLESRLGTYNKTCDHTVIHYRECESEEDMSLIESMVLKRLTGFREQANRDRFILPESRDVSFFSTTIDECVEFVLGK